MQEDGREKPVGLPCLVILEKRVVAVDSGLCREALLEFVILLALNSPSSLASLVTSFRKAFYTFLREYMGMYTSAVQGMCVGVYRACLSWLWSSKRSALISSFASQAMQEGKQAWKEDWA